MLLTSKQHQTFTFELLHCTSLSTCGLVLHELWKLCVLTPPHTWKADSLKMLLHLGNLHHPPNETVVLAKAWHFSLSLGFSACSSCSQYRYKWRHFLRTLWTINSSIHNCFATIMSKSTCMETAEKLPVPTYISTDEMVVPVGPLCITMVSTLLTMQENAHLRLVPHCKEIADLIHDWKCEYRCKGPDIAFKL